MTRMWRIREMVKASDGSWYCSDQYDVEDEQIEETISELEDMKGLCFDSYTIDPLNEYRIWQKLPCTSSSGVTVLWKGGDLHV